jgi:uncharacterized OsmC-like protein
MTPTRTASPAVDVRARQDPLRERYKQAPGEAWITDRGRTAAQRLHDPLHIYAVPGNQEYGVRWELGVHRAVGGFHDLPNPGDVLCLALAICMDSVIRMIANRHRVVLEHLEVDVTGDVDVRGTLVVSRDVPVGFQAMHCRVKLRTAPGTDPALVHRLLKGAEYSCVNLETLRRGVPIDIETDVS